MLNTNANVHADMMSHVTGEGRRQGWGMGKVYTHKIYFSQMGFVTILGACFKIYGWEL